MSFKIEYSEDKVSARGRFSVMKKISNILGLKKALNELPIIESTNKNRYEKEDLIKSFLQSMRLGLIKI
jgi:hypothetical protein